MISANSVKDLREKTGAGILDCKKALDECQGDFEKAVDWLRTKGMAIAAKKAARTATEGQVASYIHMGGKIGVLLELNCETDFVARGDDFGNIVREVAMQIAAANPRWVRREEVPPDALEREKAIFKQQAIDSGKPEHIAEKMVGGKLEKFYGENCLLEQPYIRDDSKTVQQLITEFVARCGENVQVRRFVRWQLGEGLEKKSGDFAAEVAAMAAGAAN
jgi:elongation factor Ts